MNSTLMRTTALDAVLLPAATCAPASLVVAVETRLSQETSALTQAVAGTYGTPAAVAAHAVAAQAVAAHAAAPAAAPAAAFAATATAAAAKPFAVRNRIDAMGSPSRGTPV